MVNNSKKGSAVYKPVSNPGLAEAMRGKRSSSAAQPHDNRVNRQRTRGTIKQAALKDW